MASRRLAATVAENVDARRLDDVEIGQPGVEIADLQQPVSVLRVIVVAHHLVARERLEAIAVRERHHRLDGRLRR
jgi:hypothetical protein